jgi:hypothetical protein
MWSMLQEVMKDLDLGLVLIPNVGRKLAPSLFFLGGYFIGDLQEDILPNLG